MPEVESEESFTFIDKRKIGTEPAEEPVVSAQAASDAPEEEITGVEPEMSEQDIANLAGSHGLVAYVIGLIASDAWQRLGLIPDPATGKVVKDLKQARFAIDSVAALVDVMDRSDIGLPVELRRDLQRALADLRLNFVEQSNRA